MGAVVYYTPENFRAVLLWAQQAHVALRATQPALKDIVNGVSPGTDDEVLAAMLEEADHALRAVNEVLRAAEEE